MSQIQEERIRILENDLVKARLALGKIYEIIGTAYNWNGGYAKFRLERYKVEEIAKTLQEFLIDAELYSQRKE